MAVAIAGQAPPSDDRRWKVVDARMRRLGYRPDALVEALHSVQESFGFLDRAALEYVGRRAAGAAEPGVRRRHLLLLLHARAARRPHVRRVHGNRVLHQRCHRSSSSGISGARRRRRATTSDGHDLGPHGALRRGLQRRSRRRDRRRGARQAQPDAVVAEVRRL